jgi:hypothetical protein
VGDEIHLLAENGTVLHVVSPSNATLRAPVEQLALQIGRMTWAT